MTLSNENKVYYADDTNDYVTNINDATHTMASITLSDTNAVYDCVGDITVTLNIENNSMGKVLEADDLILSLSGSKSKQTIDLSELKEIGTKKYNLVFSIDKNTTEEVKAYVQLKNKEESQIYLAGKELNINIKVDNVVCNPPKSGTEVVQEVLGVVPAGLNTDKLLGGLYRYVGACNATSDGCDGIVDNFICFGTDTPEEDCTDPSSEYMYRIIGIDPSTGDLKLIKNTAIREGSTYYYRWNNSYNSSACEGENCEWPNVNIYKRLNGLSDGQSQGYSGDTNLFIDTTTANAKYLTSGSKWYNMIKDTDWLYGDMGESSSGKETNKTADEVYAIETGKTPAVAGYNKGEYTWNKTVSAKIGLMYISDYYYSYARSGNDSSNTNCYSSRCDFSWLQLGRNGGGGDSSGDWTMSRYGLYSNDDYYPAWEILSNGLASATNLNNNNSVRPVFFLDNAKVEISGNGSVTDPFVVTEKSA